MDFGQAFSFPFKDPDWFKKIGLVGLVSLIPFIGQFVMMGWALQITRRVIDGFDNVLPNLDFGEQLGKGFQVFLIGLVYALPIIVLSIPLSIVDSTSTNMINTGDNTGGYAYMALSLCCGGLMLLYGIFMAFTVPAAIANFAAKGSLGSAFQFSEVFGLVRKAPVAYLIVILATIVAGIIAPLGSIACLVGVILTATYANAAMAHIEGQAYNQAVRAV